MKNPLTKILVGITGGVAAYKVPEIVRRLKDKNFDVRVVMTAGASNFITALTLQAVSGHPVHQDLFDLDAEAGMGHIELAKWADVILVAPASANCLAKIATGIADDLLTTLILASTAKLILAPAMNQQMWKNEAIIFNVEQLKKRQIQFLGPEKGEQACGDTGLGRLREPLHIVSDLCRIRDQNSELDLPSELDQLATDAQQASLVDVELIITAGPTVEAIDPVRFISNYSSGKMGYAIADVFAVAGAKVTLVSGPVNLNPPSGVELVSVQSANDMMQAVKDRLPNCQLFIGCAAVADYSPVKVAPQKIKKNQATVELILSKNADIIKWVGEQNKPPFIVGFAAESENLESFAKSKLKSKKMDMICANDISNQAIGFNSDENAITLFTNSGEKIIIPQSSKFEIASRLLLEVSKRLNRKKVIINKVKNI